MLALDGALKLLDNAAAALATQASQACSMTGNAPVLQNWVWPQNHVTAALQHARQKVISEVAQVTGCHWGST